MTPRTLDDSAHLHWVEHPELLRATSLACVDGRTDHEVVGTPGGTLGEIVAVLAAAEHRRAARGLADPTLPDAVIDAYLESAARALGSVYHHSDDHAVDHLRQALAARGVAVPEGIPAATAWLRSPPDEAREPLLDALGAAANTGCGHLAAMLREPEAYGVRAGLVQEVVRAFFRGLWEGEAPFELEVLAGDHHESEVVVVHSCGAARSWGRTPTMVPQVGAPEDHDSVFVFHVDAARWFRRQLCRLLDDLERDGALAGVGREELIAEAHAVADHALAATLERLAAELPVRELDPPCADEVPAPAPVAVRA